MPTSEERLTGGLKKNVVGCTVDYRLGLHTTQLVLVSLAWP